METRRALLSENKCLRAFSAPPPPCYSCNSGYGARPYGNYYGGQQQYGGYGERASVVFNPLALLTFRQPICRQWLQRRLRQRLQRRRRLRSTNLRRRSRRLRRRSRRLRRRSCFRRRKFLRQEISAKSASQRAARNFFVLFIVARCCVWRSHKSWLVDEVKIGV